MHKLVLDMKYTAIMMSNIFIVGPASVGKSTAGKILASKLGHTFIDIDRVFCQEIKLIPDYIKQFGYEGYCEANSNLVDELLIKHPDNTVFATPSGYLVHESSPHLVSKHQRIIKDKVTSILLLPSSNPEDSADEIVRRQLSRWVDLEGKYEQERRRYIERFHKYKDHGHIKIISMNKPEAIASKMMRELRKKKLI